MVYEFEKLLKEGTNLEDIYIHSDEGEMEIVNLKCY